jgi:homogentisate 1,2-dioxygenase
MLSFHPGGFTHGPHPKALTRMFEQTKPGTDEYAVMVDARDPLDVGEGGVACEWPDYVHSWKPVAGGAQGRGGG